jgi:hypothetical protein
MHTLFRPLRLWHVSLIFAAATACSPDSLVDVQQPNTFVDPSQVKTPEAAIKMRNSAFSELSRSSIGAGSGFYAVTGMFTDELAETEQSGFIVFTGPNGFDARNVGNTPQGSGESSTLHRALQVLRTQAKQAREAMQLYAANAPNVPRAWQGEMLDLEGYSVLWLAEAFCSGIPLTNTPIEGSITFTRGFTTQELLERAIALFDSAATAGADSAQYVNLALVGKARALLALGRFAAADSAVRNVPTDFVYWIRPALLGGFQNALSQYVGGYRAQDAEGGNGLIWSADPRAAVVTVTDQAGPMLWPAKYYATAGGALDPLTPNPATLGRLADGLEARLIQAEAALAAGDASWLETLNTLRRTCVGTAVCAPVPDLTTSNLPDTLTDPGSQTAREDLLFRERAMWLYMTGHRQGDFRRLVHVYKRQPSTLWPTGVIDAPAFPPLYSNPRSTNGMLYGHDFVFEPGVDEQTNNPLYGGCYDKQP